MRPRRHIIASAFSGIAMWVTARNPLAGLILFLSGVFTDIDHAFEVIIHSGIKDLTIKKVLNIFRLEPEYPYFKIYLFLHSIEYVILLCIASFYINNIYFVAFATGYTLHIIMDAAGNKLSAGFYFLTWRIINKFNVSILFKKRGI